jgi:tRNA-dihydrouridine synthase
MLAVTRAVVDAIPNTPVTVKTRLGWNEEQKVIVELAEQLQDCGIKALTIHGRTRAQMYTGEADWTLIGEVKRNPRMHIPIIGNGDITTPERAKECFDRYGVDGIMVGRATFGRPWIFREIRDYLDYGKPTEEYSIDWKLDILKQQIIASIKHAQDLQTGKDKGSSPEYRGILHVRRHLAASPIFKGIPNFRETRIRMLRAETSKELFQILNEIRKLI